MNTKMHPETPIILLCLLVSALVFLIDLSTPLGVATGVLYTTVVLFSFRLKNSFSSVLFGLFVTLLTIMGYFLSAELGIEWMVLANRALSIFVIWVTVILGLKVKQAKSKLQESVERFHLLTEQSSIMMWQADTSGAWTFISNGWLNFTGSAVNKELGKGWLENIHGDDLSTVVHAYTKLIEDSVPYQVTCRLKNNNNDYHWITLQGNACYSEQGEITGFLGTAIDINDKKKTESLLDDARQKYYHQERMASLGLLASGILHEIGNPLAGILGLLNEINEVLKSEQLTDDNKELLDSYFSMVFDELNRLTRISQDVSNFSNMTSDIDNLVDLNDLVERTCRLVLHDERIWKMELKLDLDRNIPAIKLANDHFIQILQNLVSNAIDACEQKAEHALIEVSTIFKNDKILVSVTDNGIGMSADALAQAGQEFYTTKAKGTGLGLSICSSLTDKMNGNIDISSVECEGSKVVLSFPVNAG